MSLKIPTLPGESLKDRERRLSRARCCRWRENNAELKLERDRKWTADHREAEQKRLKKFRDEHRVELRIKATTRRKEKAEEIKTYAARWRDKNRAKLKAYFKTYRPGWQATKYANDPQFKLAYLLRNRVRAAIKGIAKSASTLQLLGCTVDELKVKLESRFRPGMTWDNYGEWHVDHIKPCASFDLSDPAQQQLCFHWTNLQPLWALENLQKSDKLAA